MYSFDWDTETGGIVLTERSSEAINNEVRPVFFEELDLLGFDREWTYERVESPLMWAIGRRYHYRGRLVAETSGGGFFEKPIVRFHEPSLRLEPVDVGLMVEKNALLLNGLTHRAIEFIHKIHHKYQNKVDAVAVAFSGGKDSLVVLDLVQRTLPPDQFTVVFDDTTMEISATYEAVERAKKHWPNLSFLTARSDKPAEVTWREMGPPSRMHRWCCTVHKSAPTLIALKELDGSNLTRFLIYDGVRSEESQRRASYSAISPGRKHSTQTNVSPILKWTSAEIFLYLFERNLLYNHAYRCGLWRVGCSVCPFASKWSEAILSQVYYRDIENLTEILMESLRTTSLANVNLDQYVKDGRWKTRGGGRDLRQGIDKVLEIGLPESFDFVVRSPNENWAEWIKTLGTIAYTGTGKGLIRYQAGELRFEAIPVEGKLHFRIQNSNAEINGSVRSNVRAVVFKTAYCIHCRACEVECPTGALKVNEKVEIDETLCTQCGHCLSVTEKGCWAAKSLSTTGGSRGMEGLSKYQTFGIKTAWLEEFLRDSGNWWHHNQLGNRQFASMKEWLKEMEIIENNMISPFGNRLRELGTGNLATWGLIWVHLSRRSSLINWYVKTVPWGTSHTKDELVHLLPDSVSTRTRENGITALFYLMKNSPLGSEIGLGQITTRDRKTHILKRGWQRVPPIVVLYSIYRYAEDTGHYNISMTEIVQSSEGGPYLLFGMAREDLTNAVRGMSSTWREWLSAELVRDLDNIYLDPTRKSLGVLELA